MTNIEKIETFAFLDLETSDLPDYNYGKTSITELSIIACSEENVVTLAGRKEVPRNLHKLTLCFNPGARIAPMSTELSGLDNFMLENENKFDTNAGNIIDCFIKHLKQPVCLVAHNGDKFDYPILKKHLQRVGVDLSDEVLCIDSLAACRKLDEITVQRKPESTTVKVIAQDRKEGVESDKKFQQTLEQEYVAILNNENLISFTNEDEKIDWQKLNETTPKRSIKHGFAMKRAFPKNDNDNPNKKVKSRKELFPNHLPATPTKKYGAYKLGSIYERMVGERTLNAHHAEADVITLLKIAIAYGDEFIKYAQCNATRFSAIPAFGSK